MESERGARRARYPENLHVLVKTKKKTNTAKCSRAVAMVTDIQGKHAPVMVLMGNAATMARPRSVELAGSFMGVSGSGYALSGSKRLLHGSHSRLVAASSSSEYTDRCAVQLLASSLRVCRLGEARKNARVVCVGERVTF